MKLPVFVVDAFAEGPFTGNPAGVVPLESPLDDRLMGQIAMEMAHAETAFLLPEGEEWRLRWFTPTVEVELCGHATLASSHVLWETGRVSTDQPCVFQTLSGELRAEREGERIALDFPAERAEECPSPPQLRAAFGSSLVWTGRNRFDLLAVLDDPCSVREYEPDFGALASIGGRGVIVTAPGDRPGIDFVSRFFGPQVGVPEDPVTGSAHCCLGPYWSEQLGKGEVVGYQASARGGRVAVRVNGDRVSLLGRAVTVLEGTLRL